MPLCSVGSVSRVSSYLGPGWWKCKSGIINVSQRFQLTAADLGFYLGLMSVSKRDLLDGRVTVAEAKMIASNLQYRGWRKSLVRLESAGLLSVDGNMVQLVWDGQETAEQVENYRAKARSTSADKRNDVAQMHNDGDHHLCRKRNRPDDCPFATEYARGYEPKDDTGKSSPPTQPPTSEKVSRSDSVPVPDLERMGTGDESKSGASASGTASPASATAPEKDDSALKKTKPKRDWEEEF